MPRRNAKGRFVKSGHHSSPRRKRRSRSVAIVRSEPRVITRYRTRTSAVVHRRGRRRHSGGGGLGLGGSDLKTKAELSGWASLLGYVETNKAEEFEKVPTFGKLPREAVIGIVAHLFRKKSKHIDRISAAALTIAGYKIGANGYSLSGFEDE